ncbi:partial Histidinol dehydrogenase, partial [Patescibacteria group bacterium]
MTINIKRLNTNDADFSARLHTLLAWDESDDLEIQQRVLAIIADVKKRGDAAVIDYTNQFDKRHITSGNELLMPKEKLKAAWEALPKDKAEALQTAANRIRAYAEHQKIES